MPPPDASRGSGGISLTLPSRIVLGPGALAGIGAVLDELGCNRVLLVHGAVTQRSGLVDALRAHLGDRVVSTWGESVSPTLTITEASMRAFARSAEFDVVVAIGGGSAIDAGKIAVDEVLTTSGAGLVAVPTTLSGAELTLDCGIVEPVRKVKTVLRGHHLVARAVIGDPDLLSTLPNEVLAGSAMNAMAHCVEALYTPASNPIVRAFALTGARQLRDGLQELFLEKQRERAYATLAEASISAGVACGNASIALHHVLCHYVGPQLGLSHGAANAVMLPHVMEFNAPYVGKRFIELAQALGVEPTAQAAIDVVKELRTVIGAPARLGPHGLTPEVARTIASHALVNTRINNNPHLPTLDEVVELVMRAY